MYATEIYTYNDHALGGSASVEESLVGHAAFAGYEH